MTPKEFDAAVMRESVRGAMFGMAIAEALFPEDVGKLKELILKQAKRNAIPLFRPWNKEPRCSS